MTVIPDDWSKLNHLQVGRYAEYLVKMAFTRAGLDVYTAEVDDKGIDFVLRVDSKRYVDIQVKSLRGPGYVFLQKSKFEIGENRWLVFVMFPKKIGEPKLYLIPSTVWLAPYPPFVYHEYKGKKSKPEYGINVSKKWMERLEGFRFDRMVGNLLSESEDSCADAGADGDTIEVSSRLLEDICSWRRASSCRRVGDAVHVSFPADDYDDELLVVVRGDLVELMMPTIDWLGHWPLLSFDAWKVMSWNELDGPGVGSWLDALQMAHEERKKTCRHCRKRFLPSRMCGGSCQGCAEELDGVVF